MPPRTHEAVDGRTDLIAFIMRNREIIVIIVVAIGFAVGLGKSLSIAEMGLQTAFEVKKAVMGVDGLPGIAERLRIQEAVAIRQTETLRSVVEHEHRLGSMEATRYTAADAEKDRTVLRSAFDGLKQDIQALRTDTVQRLSRVEAKLEAQK